MSTSSRRIPQLDAVRGIAILVVILHNERNVFPALHLSMPFASGWMGVDLFFVLSGFLITGILLDSKGSGGYFRNFYARRCLRIWPLYYALLAFMFVAVPLLRPSQGHLVFDRSSPWWAYPLYLQNFLVPLPTSAAGALGVTWSLAIEEQFYLVWPLGVRYLSAARLKWLCLGIICLSPFVRLWLSGEHVNLYTNLFCRLDGLMAGGFLAVLVREQAFDPGRHLPAAWWVLLVTAPAALLADATGADWIVYSLSALASAGFVYVSLHSPRRWLQRIMTNRFLVVTGAISYGLYLLHKIPFDVVKGWQPTYPLLAFAGLLVACYAVAAVSWYLLERPFLRLKRFFEVDRSATSAEEGRPLQPKAAIL